MSDITQILHAIHAGDAEASARLLPLVYEELRRMARQHMAQERPDHTLQPTALVHEAYLRLSSGSALQMDSRGCFFAAASTAMRRILIDHARKKKSQRRGGDGAGGERVPLEDLPEFDHGLGSVDELLDLDDALGRLAQEDSQKAQLVELVYFGGLSLEEAGESMGISRATAHRYWTYARAWLKDAVRGKSLPETPAQNP